MKRIICMIKGHMSRESSCPFTGNLYDICDNCGKKNVIGNISNQYKFDEINKAWRTI
jgi:hypothetical protein